MKTKKFEINYEEHRSLDSTLDQLQSLVDGLRSGALTVARGDRRLLFLVKPGARLDFALHAERAGDRERLELSLEWRRQNLVIDAPARPEGAERELDEGELERAAQEAADEEEGADTDDLDDDLDDFDYAAETVRQSNQLAESLQHSLEPDSRH
jgi:amphi-Trp domain-containing protein